MNAAVGEGLTLHADRIAASAAQQIEDRGQIDHALDVILRRRLEAGRVVAPIFAHEKNITATISAREVLMPCCQMIFVERDSGLISLDICPPEPSLMPAGGRVPRHPRWSGAVLAPPEPGLAMSIQEFDRSYDGWPCEWSTAHKSLTG